MLQARAFLFVFVILTAFASTAFAADSRRAIPRFEGQSFAGAVGPRVDTQAILNVTPETVSLYLYFPKENMLRLLWSVPAKSVRTEDGWDVAVPERNVAFHVGVGENGAMSIDGRALRLRSMEPQEVEALPAEALAPDCRGASLEPERTVDIARIQPDRGEARTELCGCCLALIFNGCCASCYCVHNALDIPDALDALCCGFSC